MDWISVALPSRLIRFSVACPFSRPQSLLLCANPSVFRVQFPRPCIHCKVVAFSLLPVFRETFLTVFFPKGQFRCCFLFGNCFCPFNNLGTWWSLSVLTSQSLFLNCSLLFLSPPCPILGFQLSPGLPSHWHHQGCPTAPSTLEQTQNTVSSYG